MKKTFFFLAALMASAVMMAQTPTVSASKVTLMYCKTTKGTLVHEGVPFIWQTDTFKLPGTYVRTIENVRGCDSILTIKVQAPEGAGCLKFGSFYVATGNLIYTTDGTHNTADGKNTTGKFSIQTPSYAEPASGWIETIKYGYSGYNGYSPTTTGCGYNATIVRQNITGTNYDWGKYNSITIEGGKCEVGRWRGMTSSELQGMFSGYGIGAAIVNDVYGLISAPSGWTAPAGLEVKNTSDYSQNVFTAAEWAQLENSGAIFFKNGDYCTTEKNGDRDADLHIELSGKSYTVYQGYSYSNSQCPRYVRLVYIPQ